MTKRLTEKQKSEITEYFKNGKTIQALSKEFNFTKLTITRNLKKNLGEKKYKEIVYKNNNQQNYTKIDETSPKENKEINLTEETSYQSISSSLNNNDEITSNPFFEIPPLDCEIDNTKQKDLSSTPLSQAELPDVVYMVVDKKIELEIKLLKDYPSWKFLSDDELNRKTIQIYLDKKNAKMSCNKEQTVIKVPNSKIFRIVAPLLQSRGITRIVSDDQLIAL